ncbi:hypothetical protein I551_6247 [Mycobacterium ulcerans str. Harvey]|uniref:Uncharacterized protein n=1 Tax=Mycobacterium ulcerans str. Harvey TaxID=1299332 RepID=A0ABP3A780_MYCUL|nr:hypothetical protein I551_6247 [Mycobacterium ulcerans str. Harvey]
MLDPLEPADRHSELMSRLRMLDGMLQDGVCHAYQVGGNGQ